MVEYNDANKHNRYEQSDGSTRPAKKFPTDIKFNDCHKLPSLFIHTGFEFV